MTRLEANRNIVAKLALIVEQVPDWRFQQILQNVGISDRSGTDRWFEESEETWKILEQNGKQT